MRANFHWTGGRGLGILQLLLFVLTPFLLSNVCSKYVESCKKVGKITPKFVVLRGCDLQSNESLHA